MSAIGHRGVSTRKTSSNLNTDARGSRELEQSDAKSVGEVSGHTQVDQEHKTKPGGKFGEAFLLANSLQRLDLFSDSVDFRMPTGIMHNNHVRSVYL